MTLSVFLIQADLLDQVHELRLDTGWILNFYRTCRLTPQLVVNRQIRSLHLLDLALILLHVRDEFAVECLERDALGGNNLQ